MSIKSSVRFAFTDTQRALIHARGSLFAEACPGAGKTQAVVQRYLDRPNVTDLRGVALLAFTNAAVDEAKSRCTSHPHLLHVPNYIGTIDGFINRFIVGPVFRWEAGQWPSVKDNWEAVPDSDFKVPAAQREFQLSWFSVSNGDAEFKIDRVSPNQRHLYAQLKEYQIRAANTAAQKYYSQFISNGVIDSEGSRRLMWEYLDDDIISRKLSDLLEARFKEVIVDEVQDCSTDDVKLIDFLLDAGINVVMIGDLEQSIFDFRGTSPADLERLRSRVPQSHRLNDNFRCSPNICKMIDSLRYGTAKDTPIGPNSFGKAPIYVLPSANQEKSRLALIELADRVGIPSSAIVILAHRRSDAARLAGEPSPASTSANRLLQLAWAFLEVTRTSAGHRARNQSIEKVGVVLRELASSTLRYLSDERFLEAVALDYHQFRQGLIFIATRDDPFANQPSQFKNQLRQDLIDLGWDRWVNLSALKVPKGNKWQNGQQNMAPVLKSSTVHSFKGCQAPAVALVLPSTQNGKVSGVEHWKNNSPDEARRVLYVGASRAQQLLVLAVHESQLETVLHCLDRDKVPHELCSDCQFRE